MIKLFCGFDAREAVGFHVFVDSVIERASKPVEIIPLASMGLPQGSNSFTLSRFLVPHLCGYKGHAIFADASDMLMLGDVAKLDALFDPAFSVQVVKHPNYRTRHPRKYVGTGMECENLDYARKNWASLMLINCKPRSWWPCNPYQMANVDTLTRLQFGWMADDEIGELPKEWNVLVDEGQDDTGAKLLHWTAGIPAFPNYRDAPRADTWRAQHAQALEAAA